MRRLAPLAFALTIGLAASAAGQDAPDRHRLSLAAGYKAAFLCSDLFTAGLSPEQVAADDLSRIYVELRQPVAELPAEIDAGTRRVAVRFAPDLPPRVAVWRPGLGCVQLPPGADPAMADQIPGLTVPLPATAELDARPWPDGDTGAEADAPAPAALGTVVADAFDRITYDEATETTAVLVVQGGRIVAERYREGYGPHTPQRTWSVGKSLAATVLGVAVRQGLIRLEDPAGVPEWSRPGDPRQAITFANLLHMSSGLHTEGPGNRTDDVYFGGTLVAERPAGLPLEAPPGARWRYANNDTLLAMRGLRAALGDDARHLAFPFVELFWKIGMTRTTPETDWNGDFVFSSQVWTTARDLARLGLLYLNDGVWNGERLLPEGWTRWVATPAPAQPDSGPRYGGHFWIHGPDQGLPEGTSAALGNRGQYLVIVPSRDVLVIRRGFDSVGPGGAQFDIARFTADVLAALGTE